MPAILEATCEHSVLVIDAGGADISSFVGLAARAAARRGGAGILVDGGCRGLGVAAINEAITCGGVSVSGGDFIAADRTGIAAIPAGRFDEVAAIARDLDTRDQSFARAIDDGAEFPLRRSTTSSHILGQEYASLIW